MLFDDADAPQGLEKIAQPNYFGDLNLDQVVSAVIARKQPYELATFFHAPLTDLELIRFRQDVFMELERTEVREVMDEFAKHELVAHHGYQRRAAHLADRDFGHYHRARMFLNSAVSYCDTVEQLAAQLHAVGVTARGLVGLRDYLDSYRAGEEFRALRDEAHSLDSELDQVRYSFSLKDSRITVGPYDDRQPDYSARVHATFERFQQGAVTSYLPELNKWEAYSAIGVLHLVAKVHPELFGRLDSFCRQHFDYLDRTVAAFDRELQFYLGYLEYIQALRDSGLSFSYPQVSDSEKTVQAVETFDLALAAQRVRNGAGVVGNDLRLDGHERILVITGPNNGGKTTLARTLGQLLYLARLGCPVPGRDTRLFACDEILTCFERREDPSTLDGKLQDELRRLHDALAIATPRSLFILNEMFNSTSAQDGLLLSREILKQVSELDALCVCVTFLDELAMFDEKTVSVVGEVDPDDPAVRTYRLVRRPADGRAYARALAQKYGLTYEQLLGRGRS